MEVKIIFILLGIVIPVLYYIFEIFGQIEFEPFAYNIGLTVKKIILKTKVEYFNKMHNKLYVRDKIYYKFVANDICFIRYDIERPWYYRFRFAMYTYKITIENNKYLIKIKMPVAHLIFYSISLYRLVSIIFDNDSYFDLHYDLWIIITTLLFLFLEIIVKKRTLKIIINFLKIIRENK
jgi:hypothetical protein